MTDPHSRRSLIIPSGTNRWFLEYTNKYCFSCQLQAPVMNQLFEMVEKDEQLRGKVKFLAVGAGNNQNEVDSFKAEKKVPFPVVPDPKFLAYEAIGDPGATPFTLLIRKTDAKLLVARVKMGLTGTPTFMREMEESLRADWNAFARPQNDISLEEEKRRKLSLGLNETQLMKKAEESMRSPKWKVLKVVKIRLPDDQEIYVGEIEAGNKKTYLFAKLASRAPICDLCHAAHLALNGITNTFGLGYVPGPWLTAISVSKGTGSVVNGYESITGQINLDYKKPDDLERYYFNAVQSSHFKTDLNANAAVQLSENLSTMILAHSDFVTNNF